MELGESISDEDELQAQMYALIHYAHADNSSYLIPINASPKNSDSVNPQIVKNHQTTGRYWSASSSTPREVNNCYLKINNNAALSENNQTDDKSNSDNRVITIDEEVSNNHASSNIINKKHDEDSILIESYDSADKTNNKRKKTKSSSSDSPLSNKTAPGISHDKNLNVIQKPDKSVIDISDKTCRKHGNECTDVGSDKQTGLREDSTSQVEFSDDVIIIDKLHPTNLSSEDVIVVESKNGSDILESLFSKSPKEKVNKELGPEDNQQRLKNVDNTNSVMQKELNSSKDDSPSIHERRTSVTSNKRSSKDLESSTEYKNTPPDKSSIPHLSKGKETSVEEVGVPVGRYGQQHSNNKVSRKSIGNIQGGSTIKKKKINKNKISESKSTKKQKIKANTSISKSHVINLDSSSDDDSVIEVDVPENLPTTIYLDSSDDEVLSEMREEPPPSKTKSSSRINYPAMSTPVSSNNKENLNKNKNSSGKVTDSCTSPVPSIMSSVSDDFIQNDCSSLNISSKDNDPSSFRFNFGLHGSDICDVPICEEGKDSKSKTKKKTKLIHGPDSMIEITTSVITSLNQCSADVSTSSVDTIANHAEECFATPESKIKKKRRRTKSKTYPVPDQSYVIPPIDIYESESSDIPESLIDVPVTPLSRRAKKKILSETNKDDSYLSLSDEVDESQLIMANVVGMNISNSSDKQKVVSQISEDTNSSLSTSDKLNTNKKTKETKMSIQKCTEDMHSFYNENWGTDFDHEKLKKEMPYGREYWAINSADMQRGRRNSKKYPVSCGHCNRFGHKDENCHMKAKCCKMCGSLGHKELMCPNKICLNCGAPNSTFSSRCRNCHSWKNIQCEICQDFGHPNNRCPDVWRRYHLTIKNESPLIQDTNRKPQSQLHCSGCTKRGHLINSCKAYITFSDFAPPSPFVFNYSPIYAPATVKELSKESTSKSHPNTINENPSSPCIKPTSSDISSDKRKGEKLATPQGPSSSLQVISPKKRKQNTTEAVKVSNIKDVKLPNELPTSPVSTKLFDTLNVPCKNSLKTNDLCKISSVGLSGHEMSLLKSLKGKNFLDQLSSDLGVSFFKESNKSHHRIILSRCLEKHQIFQEEMKTWLKSQSEPSRMLIPKNKYSALNMLHNDLNLLKNNLGNPAQLYNSFLRLKSRYDQTIKKKRVRINPVETVCKKINKVCKVLNMILIGQAGLSNGVTKVKQLRCIMEVVKLQKAPEISEGMRDEMGEIYNSIFSTKPRDDYSELIEQYFEGRYQKLLPNPLSIRVPREKFGKIVNNKNGHPLLTRLIMARSKLEKKMRSNRQAPLLIKEIHSNLRFAIKQIETNDFSKNTLADIHKILNEAHSCIYGKCNNLGTYFDK